MSKTLKGILIGLVALAVLAGIFVLSQSTSKTLSFTLIVTAPGDWEIAIAPESQTCVRGQAVTYTITVTPTGGYDAPIQMSVAGLPEGSYTLGQNPIQPGAWTTTLTVNTAVGFTSNTSYACSLSAHPI